MLSAAEVERYSRQMLLPQVGPDAQKRILRGSVLVVGAGGLGCPVILYLAGAGVGRLGIVDHDAVDVSNLHRQIAHTTDRKGMNKAESAKLAALAVNPTITVDAHPVQFTSACALDLVSGYDVVVDATDNPGTRYLISDACVLSGKPLVSGAAIGLSGQLSVYNWKGGPCYRCVFPEPPPRGAFVSCSDGGVMGPVPGLIATQQALETLKILGEFGSPLSQRLFVYDGEDCTFRVMKLRPKSASCAICGESATIKTLTDTDEFCAKHDVPCLETAPTARLDVAAMSLSVPPSALRDAIDAHEKIVLLDVRVPTQYGICHLPDSINVPLSQLQPRLAELDTAISSVSSGGGPVKVYALCRRGIDSLKAVELLRGLGYSTVVNIAGGLDAWRREVDPSFPKY